MPLKDQKSYHRVQVLYSERSLCLLSDSIRAWLMHNANKPVFKLKPYLKQQIKEI